MPFRCSRSRPSDDHAPADAGAERERDQRRAAPAGPELELGERERAGVVDERDREAQVALERLDDRVVLPAGEVAEEHRAPALEVERPGHAESHGLQPALRRAELACQRGNPVEHDAGPQLRLGRHLTVGHDPRRRIVLEHDPLDARPADVDPQRAHDLLLIASREDGVNSAAGHGPPTM